MGFAGASGRGLVQLVHGLFQLIQPDIDKVLIFAGPLENYFCLDAGILKPLLPGIPVVMVMIVVVAVVMRMVMVVLVVMIVTVIVFMIMIVSMIMVVSMTVIMIMIMGMAVVIGIVLAGHIPDGMRAHYGHEWHKIGLINALGFNFFFYILKRR